MDEDAQVQAPVATHASVSGKGRRRRARYFVNAPFISTRLDGVLDLTLRLHVEHPSRVARSSLPPFAYAFETIAPSLHGRLVLLLHLPNLIAIPEYLLQNTIVFFGVIRSFPAILHIGQNEGDGLTPSPKSHVRLSLIKLR